MDTSWLRFIGLLGIPSRCGGNPPKFLPGLGCAHWWFPSYSEVPPGVSETAAEGQGCPTPTPTQSATISLEKRVTIRGSLSTITRTEQEPEGLAAASLPLRNYGLGKPPFSGLGLPGSVPILPVASELLSSALEGCPEGQGGRTPSPPPQKK